MLETKSSKNNLIYVALMFNSVISGQRDVCSIYLATSLFGDTGSDENSSTDSLEEFYFDEKAILTINLNMFL